jgi:hypothetical protein
MKKLLLLIWSRVYLLLLYTLDLKRYTCQIIFLIKLNFSPLNNSVFSPSQFYIVMPPRWPGKKIFFFFIPYHLNTGGTVPVPFTFLFFLYFFYNYWCHEQDSKEPGQILYRPCGVVTAADAPCETPVASLYPNATCVFHTKLLSPVVRWVLGKQCIGSRTIRYGSDLVPDPAFLKRGLALKSEKSKATVTSVLSSTTMMRTFFFCPSSPFRLQYKVPVPCEDWFAKKIGQELISAAKQ